MIPRDSAGVAARQVTGGDKPMSEQDGDSFVPEEAIVIATARDIGLSVDGSCLPGVVANRALLRRYADLVHGFALPDTCEPAYEYRP
ncbi:hypothetical protein GLI01_11570 [Gluconacetobacter liquefaciens]|nr:hypothetical protein AA0522_2563 [Gluconacetobacter liquefaciens NRIC 0522]GEB37122.1 hypothetical protein GLI01_11570 [Gluconacetobacter liquefaciens]